MGHTPKTPQDLLRELEMLRDDSYTLSQRHRRLLDAAREISQGQRRQPSLLKC
jgi:hypothetical protein